jgi:exopolysaccharide biosynthesis predicted pyruvyltransferase EpsI
VTAPVPTGDNDVIAVQQAALAALYRRHVGPGDRYALLDFPDHANVGDSAIWLGEIAMLRAITGRDPDHVCTWDAFDADAFRRDSPAGVVLLHGGGNLGDIWPHHQHFREAMLAEFRDRTIVQLPQSIHFRAGEGLDRFAACVAAHPDFHLYVRDAQSLDLAQRLSCTVALAPDSAFALGAQPRGPADCDLLMLMRADDERVAGDRGPVPKGAVVLDWLEDGVLPAWEAGVPRHAHYERLARVRVARGLTLLSRGRQVVTDRLHAHILALLLGIPHVALDNDYGKLSAYIAAWTARSPLLLRE